MYAEIPFKTLHFLTYDINYGGRVTDDVDRRTICTILDDFINENVLSDDYSFSASGSCLCMLHAMLAFLLPPVASTLCSFSSHLRV